MGWKKQWTTLACGNVLLCYYTKKWISIDNGVCNDPALTFFPNSKYRKRPLFLQGPLFFLHVRCQTLPSFFLGLQCGEAPLGCFDPIHTCVTMIDASVCFCSDSFSTKPAVPLLGTCRRPRLFTFQCDKYRAFFALRVCGTVTGC